jgi:hypothetical protein
MKEFKNMILKNYKTAIPGILTLVSVGLYFFDIIDSNQLLTGIGVLVSAGLIASKDAKKSLNE